MIARTSFKTTSGLSLDSVELVEEETEDKEEEEEEEEEEEVLE
jgi:Ran GTPase-activating protein (RanGAP) involved in mRNA processing and transport